MKWMARRLGRLKYGALCAIALLVVGCQARSIAPLSSATTVPTATALPPASIPLATRVRAASPNDTPVPLPTDTFEPVATAAPTIDPLPSEIVATVAPANGDLDPLGQHAYSVTLELTGAKGVTRTIGIDYLLYLPGDYRQDSQQPWPLILFMHGSDQRGTDAEMVAADGLPKMLTTTLDFPAMVLSPQVPEDETWNTQLPEATALLDYIQAHYAVDPKRLYLTGISMGSFGAWDLALRYPRRFAALVPIAGGWDSERDTVPRNICNIKDVPIWVFHGQQDDIVPPRKSEIMVNALRRCGSTVKFTMYPDTNHRESWARAYADPNLYEWLLQQSLP